MSIWFTAIPNGFEKLLELCLISCLFFTNTMVYGVSLANCKRQKGCFPFWCIIWLLFFLRGNQNSLKTTLGYTYFLIWAVLTILKPWVLNFVVLLLFFFLALRQWIPLLSNPKSHHIFLTIVCLKALVLSFFFWKWNGVEILSSSGCTMWTLFFLLLFFCLVHHN